MITIEELQKVVADNFDGALTTGQHNVGGAACVWEAYNFATRNAQPAEWLLSMRAHERELRDAGKRDVALSPREFSWLLDFAEDALRLRAVLRWTHDTYCFADYGKHAPECLLCELGEEETTE